MKDQESGAALTAISGQHSGGDAITEDPQASPPPIGRAGKRARQTRRSGQIIPRGGGKFMVRVFLGRDPDTGRRSYHNRTIRGTKKDADKYLTGVQRQIDMGEFIEPSAMTVNAFLDKWFASMGSRVTEQTLRGYRYMAANHIRPIIGNRKLSSIQTLDVQQIYAAVEGKGLSACTVRHVYNVLTGAFSQAVEWRMLKSNPARYAKLPKENRKEMRPLLPEEAGCFLAAARSSGYGTMFATALTGGMRPSEYLALQWADVDLEKGTVTVKRTMQWKTGGGWYFGVTKTEKSKRLIPLPQSTVKMIAEHRGRQLETRMRRGAEYQNNDLVFADESGKPITLARLRKKFQKILRAAGLPLSIRVYDLRHSCATFLLAAGENPKIVSERLGHASVKMTLDVYSHVLPTMQQGAAEKLEKACFGGLGAS